MAQWAINCPDNLRLLEYRHPDILGTTANTQAYQIKNALITQEAYLLQEQGLAEHEVLQALGISTEPNMKMGMIGLRPEKTWAEAQERMANDAKGNTITPPRFRGAKLNNTL
jgi:hypothetical protein